MKPLAPWRVGVLRGLQAVCLWFAALNHRVGSHGAATRWDAQAAELGRRLLADGLARRGDVHV